MHWEPAYSSRRVSLKVADRRGCAASFFGNRDILLTTGEKAARPGRNQGNRGRAPTVILPLNTRIGERIFPGTTLVGPGRPRMKRGSATRKAPWGLSGVSALARARGEAKELSVRVRTVWRAGKVRACSWMWKSEPEWSVPRWGHRSSLPRSRSCRE